MVHKIYFLKIKPTEMPGTVTNGLYYTWNKILQESIFTQELLAKKL